MIELSLKSKASRKYITRKVNSSLLDVCENETMRSYYKRAMSCADVVVREGEKLRATYCNCRSCTVCNSIRTAKCINGYLEQLESFKDPYFITLTAPNVYKSELDQEIKRMNNCFKKINNSMYKKYKRGTRPRMKGIKKIECTYNNIQDTYNPHFHLIVNNKLIAQEIIQKWLDLNPQAKIYSQNFQKANKESMKEVLKYSVKSIQQNKNGTFTIYAKALDHIYRCFYRKKIHRCFGGLKKVDTEIKEGESFIYTEAKEEYKNEMRNETKEMQNMSFEELAKEAEKSLNEDEKEKAYNLTKIYKWSGEDWHEIQTGEGLSGHVNNIEIEVLKC